MNTQAGLDIGPLSWVKGEIDLAMQRGVEALRAFAASPSDVARIRETQGHVHQAHGALEIVGLGGVTRVSEELESLLTALENEPTSRTPAHFAAAEEAVTGIVAYLDGLMNGAPEQALRLYPVYAKLHHVCGRGAADPVDLYFPDVSARPPRSAPASEPLPPASAEKLFRDQRALFQRGMLRWIKGDAGGAEDMRASVAAIELAQEAASQHAYWWAALAFLEALAAQALPADLDVKRMCNRIEQQMRRLVDGAQNVAERQMREVLYFVAHARPETPQVLAAQQLYALAGTIPAAEDAARRPADPPALKLAREALAQAKDAWNKFASGNPPSLIAFRSASGVLKDRTAELSHSEVAALARELAVLATWLSAHAAKMSEAIALEVATALLLLENALANFATLGAEFAEQSQFICSRLKACILGKLLRTAPTIPLLDEMSRKAQERLLLGQVVAEMQTNLRRIEQVLDGFFRDPEKRAELAELSGPLHQVRGALDVLGETRARDTLMGCETDIARLAQSQASPQQAEFEQIAQTLSGLGFYIEGLAVGKADFDAAMRPIATRRRVVEQPAAPSVEEQLVQQKREAQSLIQEWKKKPTDTWLRQELHKNLAAMQKDASLAADTALEHQAGAALRVLEKTAEEAPLQPDIAAALESAVPVPPAPPPSAEAAKLVDASAEVVDAELLAVYLEEADEVLAAIRENLARVRAHPADRPALTVIRRSFHTLKGSGRMVGLTHLGEAAWGVEQTMNLWLQEERAATPDLLSLLEDAQHYFADNVARLKAGGGSSDEGPLVEQAQRVRIGEPLAPADSPAPVPQAAEEFAVPVLPEPAAPDVSVPVPAESSAPVVSVPAIPGSAPEVPSPAQPAAPGEELVRVGDKSISATVFSLFQREAETHLKTMREEREVLVQQAVVTDALIRATHTLAGIAATVELDAVRELAREFELALETLSTIPLSATEEALVGVVIEGLSGMISQAQAGQLPDARPDLVTQLRRAMQPAMVASAEALLPEEEGAFGREAEVPEVAEAVIGLPAAPPPEESSATAPVGPVPPAARGDVVEQIAVDRRQRRMRDDIDPQLLPVFLAEVAELLPAIGAALRDWRAHRDDASIGQRLQRLLHTLKGSARMAGAMPAGELTHHMESRVENGLAMKSLSDNWFDTVETSYDRLGALLERVGGGAAEDAAAPEAPAAPLAAAPAVAVAEPAFQTAMLRVRAEVVDRLVTQAGEVSIARSRIEGEMRALRGAMQELTDNVARLRSQLREIEIQAESQMQSRMQEIRDAKQQFDPLEFDRFTRFQELTRLMAESVSDVQTVHQNLLHAVDQTEVGLVAQARLNRDLQQDLMRVRMVPFASLAERLYRVVRQTAKEIGKRVNLDIRGAQVDLDRSVLERITAPFEHMLRNSVTHGIERPEERRSLGKPEFGDIRIEVTQEGNDVLFTMSDDGRGLDLPRIREKAVTTGLIRPEASLTDSELADFIFLPGFSTASHVTEVAGRGVGMDVVRTEVSALGGRIELSSERDRGTRFTIYLPLTLAVTQAVLVKSAGRTYAFPAVMVEQVQQLKPEDIGRAFEAAQAEWQTRRYPFRYLPRLLGQADAQPEAKRLSSVMFLRSGSNAVALLVDDILGSSQEIVVKAIGPQLQRVPGIVGATVLGSGEIVLILNPVLLAMRETVTPVAAAPPAQPAASLRPAVMVVDDSLTVRKITGRLLAREGYEVIVAKDGVEALELLQQTVPDVMLVDIEMPRMDGFDLTRNVRADPRLRGVPIIMITSRTAEKHQAFAKEIGANLFLGKPYQEEELLRHIAGYVKAGTGG